ncbi:MAG: hypothetical protein U1C51_02590, partial [Candidatus Izemoplasmatales bacterium]|nr:hypothetical protein [Candidatus Izemoplasmatales bacterium]
MASKSTKFISNRFILIKQYALAAINLYGVIKLDDFISVFNHYETQSLTKDEAIPLLELLSSIDEIDLSFKQNILSNGYFYLGDAKDMKAAKSLASIQAMKPRFLPAKAEFMQYLDAYYIEPMKPLLALEKFIVWNKLGPYNDLAQIRDDMFELHTYAMFSTPLSEFIHYVQDKGYQFESEQQVDMFVELVMNVNNNTRMYENNGFTPLEIGELFE